jgi:hypothetical protein
MFIQYRSFLHYSLRKVPLARLVVRVPGAGRVAGALAAASSGTFSMTDTAYAS